MTTERTTAPRDRLLNPDGFRHYRRTYSRAELRWGLFTGAVMAGIVGWVAWKGAHPDPALFGEVPIATSGTGPAVVEVPAPLAGRGAEAEGEGTPSQASGPAPAAGARGPLPTNLAGNGFREDKLSSFDAENLYVKIDGRADYFKSFGFRQLWSALLVSEKDPAVTIDLEMYDMGNTANALGAYGGERAPTAKVEVSDTGLSHIDRNALFAARGPYYLRVIGSDESPPVLEALKGLSGKLQEAVKGEPLPWSYGLFVAGLGLDPGNVIYFAENAFSFGFAADVWTARPKGKDNDLEIFVAARASAKEAKALGAKLHKGFAELGEAGGTVAGVQAVKDPLLGTMTAVATRDRFVYGVRGAADAAALETELGGLGKALETAPAALLARAKPATAKSTAKAAGGNGEH